FRRRLGGRKPRREGLSRERNQISSKLVYRAQLSPIAERRLNLSRRRNVSCPLCVTCIVSGLLRPTWRAFERKFNSPFFYGLAIRPGYVGRIICKKNEHGICIFNKHGLKQINT